MRSAILAFAAGVWALQAQAELPDWSRLAVLAGVGLALGAAAQAVRSAPVARVLVVLASFGLGFAFAAGTAKIRMADRLDPAWEGRDVAVTGVVASLPQPFERGVRFEFDVEPAAPADFRAPSRILLSWYNGLTPEEFQEVLPIRAGERWRLTVRLRRPHGNANPHGFDYEVALLERGIGATGYRGSAGGALSRRAAALLAVGASERWWTSPVSIPMSKDALRRLLEGAIRADEG